MTTQDRPREPHRITMWLAHHRAWIMTFWSGSVAVGVILKSDLIDLVNFGGDVGLAATVYAQQKHSAILCGRCAAEFPIDGAEQAARKIGVLRWRHKWATRSLLAALALFGVSVVWYPAIIFAAGLLTADYWVADVHRKLELWCPWCRGWKDGDEMPIRPPVPTGESTH